MKRILTIAALVFVVGTTRAHFVWMSANADHQVEFYFGESPADRNYHLPDSLTPVTIWHVDEKGERRQVERTLAEEKDFVGYRGVGDAPSSGYYESAITYGLFQKSKLTYFARHLISSNSTDWPTEPTGGLELEMIVGLEGNQLTVRVIRKGEPAQDAKVQVFGPNGEVKSSQTTDDEGIAHFAIDRSGGGTMGLLVGITSKDEVGEWEGRKYQGASNYSSLTFPLPAENASAGR